MGRDYSHQEIYEPLSKREQEILTLLARNLSDREIANTLFIAYTTVKWYNRQIFNKLGVENRQQAAAWAVRVGLVDSPTLPASAKLPAQLTPFIGRFHEIETLQQFLLDPAIRLITIHSPGGMGKTRLALKVAEEAANDFAQGMCFVPLVSVDSQEGLISAIANNIGLHLERDGRSAVQQLFDFLKHKCVLLILDNFEYALNSASLVSEILSHAAKIKILVTSREELNLNGETVYKLYSDCIQRAAFV